MSSQTAGAGWLKSRRSQLGCGGQALPAVDRALFDGQHLEAGLYGAASRTPTSALFRWRRNPLL
ncbi:MAG: hypothetical protein MUC60_00565 [Oscillatoria sp. Prado101]|nr:hypothetical protein [Oscillatoria sp. Prado101]